MTNKKNKHTSEKIWFRIIATPFLLIIFGICAVIFSVLYLIGLIVTLISKINWKFHVLTFLIIVVIIGVLAIVINNFDYSIQRFCFLNPDIGYVEGEVSFDCNKIRETEKYQEFVSDLQITDGGLQ